MNTALVITFWKTFNLIQ